MFDLTDVLAAMLVVFASLRRLEAKTVRREDNPHVDEAAFHQWQRTATSAYGLTMTACLLKVGLNNGWYFLGTGRIDPRVMITGHWVIFVSWLGALLFAWFRSTEGRHLRATLGIRAKARPPTSGGADSREE